MSIFSDNKALMERQKAMKDRMEMRKMIKNGIKDFRKARKNLRRKHFSHLKSVTYKEIS